jgi:putative FmdB family regulatory protein
MPIYEYRCEHCGPFEERRLVAERNADARCPQCRQPAARQVNFLPTLLTHRAERTERPEVPARHPSGCGCGGH